MKMLALVVLIALAAAAGCSRVKTFGTKVMKNQEQTVKGVLYTDTLITSDGSSPLTERKR